MLTEIEVNQWENERAERDWNKPGAFISLSFLHRNLSANQHKEIQKICKNWALLMHCALQASGRCWSLKETGDKSQKETLGLQLVWLLRKDQVSPDLCLQGEQFLMPGGSPVLLASVTLPSSVSASALTSHNPATVLLCVSWLRHKHRDEKAMWNEGWGNKAREMPERLLAPTISLASWRRITKAKVLTRATF